MRIATLIIVFAALLSGRALAASSCAFTTSPSLSFGIYNVFGSTDLTAHGSLAVSCKGRDVPLMLTLTTGHSGQYARRDMVDAGHPTVEMAYNIYLNSVSGPIFGNGTSGTGEFVGNSPSTSETPLVVNFYGDVTALQDIDPGSYSDSLSVTLSY